MFLFVCFFVIHRSAIFQWPFFALISGIVIATVLWYLVNHFMRNQRPHSPEQFVEWFYALDIHFNAFFPFFLICGVLQVPLFLSLRLFQHFLLPLLLRPGWLAVVCSDLLIIAGIACYTYITFLGYMCTRFSSCVLANEQISRS